MEEGSISDPVVRSVLGVRLKVALVRMRQGHAAEVLANRYLVSSTCLERRQDGGHPADRLARCQRAANSSGYANLSIKEGIGSILRVRKLGPRVPGIVSIVETWQGLKIPIRDYLYSG
jgi:hypothetical protein